MAQTTLFIGMPKGMIENENLEYKRTRTGLFLCLLDILEISERTH
jgi:hypothetical protein